MASHTLIIRGLGPLSEALEDFAEDLQDRFPDHLRVRSYDESPDGSTWLVRCDVNEPNPKSVKLIKDYLQLHFPSEDGHLEVSDTVIPLFDVIPGVFFVFNATDTEGEKIELQLVDRFGRARKRRLVNAAERDVMFGDTQVPIPVLDAGLRQPVGTGDFVASDGQQVNPRDFDEYFQNGERE